MDWRIRLARPADAAELQDIESDAARSFRSVEGLEWIADHVATSAEEYVRLIAAASVWIAETQSIACGFLAARAEGSELHIVEVSVRRDYQRRGLASQLISTAVVEARRHRLKALTLTTFRDVPWNGPLYARLGFSLLGDTDLSDRLRAELGHDVAAGLPLELRCAMRLSLET